MFSVENVGIALPGIAFDTFSPDAARAFFESQPPMYLAMSALFFSSIIMCPLPDMPAFASSTCSVFTPACISHCTVQ